MVDNMMIDLDGTTLDNNMIRLDETTLAVSFHQEDSDDLFEIYIASGYAARGNDQHHPPASQDTPMETACTTGNDSLRFTEESPSNNDDSIYEPERRIRGVLPAPPPLRFQRKKRIGVRIDREVTSN